MVSVIIPSYNSESTIAGCLKALLGQNCAEPFEIILVDSSADRTPEIVRAEYPNIKYTHLPVKTDPGTARNLGLSQSSGEIICFIDSDCQAMPGWIENYRQAHRAMTYHAIGGSVVNGNDPALEVAWAGYFAEFREFIPEQARREVSHIPTCNISYKRSVLENLGGFNPSFYPQEDLELNFRLQKNGGKILFLPGAQVRHRHRETAASFYQHQRRVGEITSRMLKILPLEGQSIACSRLKTILAAPLLPAVKWLRTVLLFNKLNPRLLREHPKALWYLACGMWPWMQGFIKGVFTSHANFPEKCP